MRKKSCSISKIKWTTLFSCENHDKYEFIHFRFMIMASEEEKKILQKQKINNPHEYWNITLLVLHLPVFNFFHMK
jgi:hypothetical protein